MSDIKIFISSVQREFAKERRMLCDYIRTDALLGRFFIPFIFEEMPAKMSQPQRHISHRQPNATMSLTKYKLGGTP